MTSKELCYSVVIPAYKEAGTIKEAISRVYISLEGHGIEFEVIVVCDGDENTKSALDRASFPGLTIIHYEENHGKGFAIRTGAAQARGKNLVFLDADLDLDATRLPELITVFEEEDFDLLVGSKLHQDSVVNYPQSRKAMSLLYRGLIKMLFGLDISDTQTGMKICNREKYMSVSQNLCVNGFAFDLEMICNFKKMKYSIGEGPVTLNYQFKSTVNLKAIIKMLVSTLKIYIRMRR